MASNFYDLLGVARAATVDEIKAAYHQAALRQHPDKQQGANNAHGGAGVSSSEAGASHSTSSAAGGADGAAAAAAFHALSEAWQTLRDPQRRARYDRLLTQRELRATVTLQDEIDLGDMEAEDDPQEGEVRTYVCRCGDVYVLHPGDAELAELEAVVVPCCSCSNHMLVRLRAPAGG